MHTWSSTKSDWVSNIYSSQDVRNTRPCALSLSKLLGTPGLTLEGCDSFRDGYRWGDQGRGGDISCHLLVTHDRYKLVEGFVYGSGGLRLLIEPLLYLLEPFFIHGRCKSNLTDLRRVLHLSLAKGNPK
jgi:hypothetical protein